MPTTSTKELHLNDAFFTQSGIHIRSQSMIKKQRCFMLYKDIKTNRCKYFRKKCSKKCNWNGKSVILRVCDGVKREMNNRRYTCEILYTSKQSHNVTHREVRSNRITKLLVLKGLRINKQQNKKKCCCFNKIRILKKSTNVMNTPRQLKVGLQIS